MGVGFPGFPRQCFQFYKELAANNNRDWFQAHKQDYLDYVQAPAVEFVIALGERLKTLSKGGITYDTRTNGAGSIMRIYRDIRFSKDKSPYKTNLGIVFGQAGKKKMEGAGFYFHLDSDGAAMYDGHYQMDKPHLAVYRDAVADAKLGAELEKALASIARAGKYVVGGEQYKRVPPGFDPALKRADLLKYKGLYVRSPPIGPATVTSLRLVDTCVEHCRNMLPLQQWFERMASRVEA